jgi:hypothetical protein
MVNVTSVAHNVGKVGVMSPMLILQQRSGMQTQQCPCMHRQWPALADCAAAGRDATSQQQMSSAHCYTTCFCLASLA